MFILFTVVALALAPNRMLGFWLVLNNYLSNLLVDMDLSLHKISLGRFICSWIKSYVIHF